MNDVTKDLGDGLLLIQLVEVLSEQPCPLKYNRAPRLAIQKVENVAVALQFVNRFTKVNINPQGEWNRPFLKAPPNSSPLQTSSRATRR